MREWSGVRILVTGRLDGRDGRAWRRGASGGWVALSLDAQHFQRRPYPSPLKRMTATSAAQPLKQETQS